MKIKQIDENRYTFDLTEFYEGFIEDELCKKAMEEIRKNEENYNNEYEIQLMQDYNLLKDQIVGFEKF